MARKYKYQINSKRGIIKAVERPSGTTPIRESKGAYDPKATYTKGDTVIYGGLYYTATTGQGVPGEGDGWEISGIVSAKAVTLTLKLSKPVLDVSDGAKAVTATSTATLGEQDITAGLPADGWRWTWRGKELSGETKSSTTLTDIPLEVGQYPVRVTHKLFGTFVEEQVVRVDVTTKLRAELEEALEGLRKATGDDQAAMAEILGKVNKTLTSLQEQVDNEVSNWFYPGAPGPDKEPENEWITNQDKYRHIGDTYTSVDESGEYMGKSWRYTTEYKWQEIHDTLISKALAVAAKAQTTADGKSTTYYTQPSRYSVGDSWVLSSDTTVGGKVYKKGTMLFANSSSDVYVGAHWSDILKYIDSAKLEADLRASERKSKEAWEAYAAAKASKAGEDAVKAAKEYAEAQDAAYEERTRAYADKILTEKEQALIAAADAKAAAAEERAKAYADGKVTEAEQLAIDKAQKAYDDAVKRAKELDSEIQVGGRNLVLKSKRLIGPSKSYYLATYAISDKTEMVVGETYTITVWGETTLKTQNMNIATNNGNIGITPWVPYDENRKVWQKTFIWQGSKTYTVELYAGGKIGGGEPDAVTTVTKIKLERGTVATDWTPAPEDVQSEIDAAKEQATKAQTSTDKLRGYVDGAFRDGVVDDAEAKAIKTYINEVDAQWQSALGAYEKVYTNALLTGAPKTALLDCKTTLAGKCDDLTQYIATAIADGRATSAEVNGVNSRYNAYKVALRDFQKALKEAEDYIRSKGSGGKYLGEANALSYDGGVQLESGRFVYGKAGDTVRMTNTGSNSITSWEKGKVYILVLTTDKGYEILVWVTLTGRDGKDGAPGKKGDKGDKGDGLEVVDTRNDNQPPSWYRRNYRLTTVREFKIQSVIEIPSRWIYAIYCTLETTVRWADTSGGRVEQSTTLDNGTQLRRVGTADDTAWEPWINITAQVQEINQGLANANTLIAALQTAKDEIEKGKLGAGDLPAHLQWIYKAFNEGETNSWGGLTLTQIIGLSNIDGKITSYLSGRNAKGAHMLAAGVTSLTDQDAVSYINYDGTAKFGGVKINRDSIYIDADESKSSDPQKVVRDRLYIFRSGLFAYLKNYIEGGIGHGIFRASYESGFHSKRVSIGGGGTSVIQAPRGNTMGLRIEGNLHVLGDKLEYNDQRILHEEEPRMHDMRSEGGSVSLTKEDTSVLIGNEALSSAHCTITLPDASTVKPGWRCTVTTMGAVVDGSIAFKTKYSSQKMFWGSDRQVSSSHNYAEKSNIIVALRISDQNTNNGTAYWFVKEIRAY